MVKCALTALASCVAGCPANQERLMAKGDAAPVPTLSSSPVSSKVAPVSPPSAAQALVRLLGVRGPDVVSRALHCVRCFAHYCPMAQSQVRGTDSVPAPNRHHPISTLEKPVTREARACWGCAGLTWSPGRCTASAAAPTTA